MVRNEKKVVHLGPQSVQLDMKALFILWNIVFFFCILISGFSAHSCLLFCVVIHYIGAKYSLDCPVVTLDLSGSLARLNKSHMQILMEIFWPFISHSLTEGKGGRLGILKNTQDLFSDPKKEILIQLREKWSIRNTSGRIGLLPTAYFEKEMIQSQIKLFLGSAEREQCVNILTKCGFQNRLILKV